MNEYRDVDPSTVVVGCIPDHTSEQIQRGTIWLRRFVGVKVAENPNGTIRVQVVGDVPDLTQAVFRR